MNYLMAIFVVSPGRGGTGYAHALFECVNDACVRHEPLPLMGGLLQQQWNDGIGSMEMRDAALRRWNAIVSHKSPNDGNATSPLYVETNAQFAKGWGIALLDALSAEEQKRIGVLYLERDREAVAASFAANLEAPGFEQFANAFNVRPQSTVSLDTNDSKALATMTPYEACEWQWAEMHRRAAFIESRFQSCRFVRRSLADLQSVDEVLRMFDAFSIDRMLVNLDNLQSVVGVRCNSGAERAHLSQPPPSALSSIALSYAPSLREQQRLVRTLSLRILSEEARERIASNRRSLLGSRRASCMLGAKLEMQRQAKLIDAHRLDFTEIRFQLMCELVYSVDPNDVAFSFIDRVAPYRYVLAHLNRPSDDVPGNLSLGTRRLVPISLLAINRTLSAFIVTVSGACGKLAPPLIASLCERRTSWSPPNRPLCIRLLVRRGALNRALAMRADLSDAYGTTIDFEAHEDERDAFVGAHLVVLCASEPRKPHYERFHLAERNRDLYIGHARCLATAASETCHIMVVANPVLYLCALMGDAQPTLRTRISGVGGVDQVRAERYIQDELVASRVNSGGAQLMCRRAYAIGNHSLSVYTDHSNALFVNNKTKCALRDVLDQRWLESDLQTHVRSRGRYIITHGKHTAIHSVVESCVRHAAVLVRGIDPAFSTSGDGDEQRSYSMIVWCNSTKLSIAHPLLDETRSGVWPPSLPHYCGFLSVPARTVHVDSSAPYRRIEVDAEALRCALHSSEEARIAVRKAIDELRFTSGVNADETEDGPGAAHTVSVSIPLDALSAGAPPLGPIVESRIKLAKEALEQADVVLVHAGAGLSVDCGIPDLVDFARHYEPLLRQNMHSIFDVSNEHTFRERPELAWGFFGQRALEYGDAQPSETYSLLKRACTRARAYFVETTNIDCMFARADFDADVLYERHGTLFDIQCSSPDCAAPVRRATRQLFETLDIDVEHLRARHVPLCAQCGAPERIATTLAIDTSLRRHEIVERQKEARRRFFRTVGANREWNIVILEIGVGRQVPKLRERARALLAERRRQTATAPITFIRVNPSDYALDDVQHIRRPAPRVTTTKMETSESSLASTTPAHHTNSAIDTSDEQLWLLDEERIQEERQRSTHTDTSTQRVDQHRSAAFDVNIALPMTANAALSLLVQ